MTDTAVKNDQQELVALMSHNSFRNPVFEEALRQRDAAAPRPSWMLTHAINRSRFPQLELLVKYGWDANADIGPDRIPLLAHVLLNGAPSETVTHLLVYHADPFAIPADLWLLGEPNLRLEMQDADQRKASWCSDHHRTELAQVLEMDFETKCQLNRAAEVQKLYDEPKLREFLAAPSIAHFPYKNIKKIGQGKVCDKVMDCLQSFIYALYVQMEPATPGPLIYGAIRPWEKAICETFKRGK